MKGYIDPAEWDFSGVPDGDVRDCCLYEYGREAERALWLACRQTGPNGGNEELRPRFQFLDMSGRADDCEDPFVLPAPWLTLPTESRTYVKFALARLRRNAPHIPGNQAILPPVTLIRAQDARQWAKSGEDFLRDAVAPEGGRVWIARELNLAAYTDAEMVEAFRATLADLRSRTLIAEPSIDRMLTWIQRLDNLGLMRLRRWVPRDELPSALRRHRSFGGMAKLHRDAFQRQLDDRMRSVRSAFRDFFPELGAHAKPESDEPHV